MAAITLIEALTLAMASEMRRDPSVVVLGEDVGVNGGVFRATSGLIQEFGAGRVLGREWHRDTAYGVAARGYIKSGRSDDEWISSHLELRGSDDRILSGYGWIFPLGDGEVNIGVGTLATAQRPADINLRSLLSYYADTQREDWELHDDVRAPWSAPPKARTRAHGCASSCPRAGPRWTRPSCARPTRSPS